MKKNNKWRTTLIAYAGVMLVAIILLISMIIGLLNNDSSYKIEPRSENVEEYKRKSDKVSVNGWIKVQGTNIDYPVIYVDERVDINNAIDDFAWVVEEQETLLDKTIILGHNIKNVSSNPLITAEDHNRFEQLMSFIYYDFAKENQYIQYTRDGKDYLYKIFAVSFEKAVDFNYSSKNISKKELKEYIETTIENSYFKYDVEVDENNKIITLVTCTRFFGNSTDYNFKIDAKLVEEDESTEKYSVKVKDSYKEIENIMKGGNENGQNA